MIAHWADISQSLKIFLFRVIIMKTKVEIDPKKIKRLKKKIQNRKYIDNALNKLAGHLTSAFIE